MTARGIGVSWGLAGFRIGRSPTGSLWVSFTIPGTGVSFLKYLGSQSRQSAPQLQRPPVPTPPPALPQARAPSPPLTANQRVLEEIRRGKP